MSHCRRQKGFQSFLFSFLNESWEDVLAGDQISMFKSLGLGGAREKGIIMDMAFMA